jgi:hypothetical protein
MRNGWIAAIVAAILLTGGAAQAQQPERPARILGRPNFNGIWQALNTAYWNLEAHRAEALDKFWQLGKCLSSCVSSW